MRSAVALCCVLVLSVVAACRAGSDEHARTDSSTSTSTSTTTCVEDHTHVPVVVASKPIEKGTTAEQAMSAGALEEKTIPFEFYPPTGIDSLDTMAGGTAVADLAPNQVATRPQWDLPGTDPSPPTPCG
jgi:hypothetical protein